MPASTPHALTECSGLRRPILRHYRRALPGIYEYHIVRTRYIDETVIDEVADGAQQVVILGAGFDTRALRMHNVLPFIQVFEVDHPATSRKKQDQLMRIGGLPVNMSFIALDFESDELLPACEAGGYRTDLRTVFIWEGVSMFLSEAAVASTLGLVASAAPNSAVVFDYILRSVADGRYEHAYGARQAARYLASQGEPYVFGLEHDEVRPFLSHHRLVLELCHSSRELQERYLRRRDGGLLGRVNGFHGIARARSPYPDDDRP